MTALALEYERDFHRWIEQHIFLLKKGNLDGLDREHLIEELEGMANRDRHELVSHFIILIAHLLKWQFQLNTLTEHWKEFEGKSWRNSILEQRYRIADQLEYMPILKNSLPEALAKAYPKALCLAVDETGLSKAIFPQTCPYSIEQLLDKTFYPDFVH